MENENGNEGTQGTMESTQQEQGTETMQSSAENASAVESHEITEETTGDESAVSPNSPRVFSIKGTYIPQSGMLIMDLTAAKEITQVHFDRAGAVSEEEASQTPAPTHPARRTRQQRPQAAARGAKQKREPVSHVTAAAKKGNGNDVAIEPGKKIKINAPAPGMVVRSDQSLMVKLHKDGTGDILQTENWGYPPPSVTPESIVLKSKPTANFLNFQEPTDGYRFAWMVNLEKQEVIQVAKKGKFTAKDVHSFMDKGFTEFMYAPGPSSKHFRLPNGTIVTSKKLIDLNPEETRKEAKKEGNKPSVATLTGALSGTLKG